MKKFNFISLLLIFTMVMSFIPAKAAITDEILVTSESSEFSTTGSFVGSGLVGYNDTPTLYSANDSAATATFTPFLLNGGVYKVEVYNMAHSTNSPKVYADMYVDGELVHTEELNHVEGEGSMIDIGTYELSPGRKSYVTLRNGGSQFLRVNSAKFTLLKKSESAISLVDVSDDEYPAREWRTLDKKDVDVPDVKEGAVKIYVKDGAADGDGSLEKPFGTIEEAQEKARSVIASGYPADGVAVILREGVYALDNTFTLTNADSGTAEAPVIYSSYEGENVTLTAGKDIPGSYFKKVEDNEVLNRIAVSAKDDVLVTDLSRVGLNNIADMNLATGTPYTLVMGSSKGTLARWPNEGYGKTGEIIDTAARSDSGPRKKGFTYEITDAAALRWKDAHNAWLNGYWMTPYTINYSSLAKVDVDNMKFVGKEWNALGNYGGARYYIENLLEELDNEGEWYLDTKNNLLYIYPYADNVGGDVMFAASDYDVVRFDNCKNVVMSGINVEVGGANGVTLSELSSDCMFMGGKIRFVSGNGAHLTGRNNTVRDCDISYVGSRGIVVSGGNDMLLDPAGNVAENNEIHNTGTGGGQKQGITFGGCGNIIAHNHIYDIPTHGINGGGMENIVEYNIVERTNLEMGDTGGIYILNYGLAYGTKVRYNIVKDTTGIMPVAGFSGEGAIGIYIDDMTSGLEIYGNIIINHKLAAIYIHGGRNSKIYNNMIINCDVGMTVVKTGIAKNLDENGATWQNLLKYKVTEGPISQKYPQAAQNFTDEFGNPINNEVRNNVGFSSGAMEVSMYKGCVDENNVSFEGLPDCNMTDFYDLDYTNIRSKCPAFEEIPIRQIGTYTGGKRTDTEAIIFDNRADEFNATYPENGATDILPDVTFKWERGTGGIRGYDLYVATDPEFKDIIGYKGITDGDAEMTFEYGKTYYWRVSATPMLNYENRWNNNGVMSFTVVSAEDMLYGDYLSAKALINTTTEGKEPGMYPRGSKEALNSVMTETLDAINSGDSAKMVEMKDKLAQAKKEFMNERIIDNTDMTTVFYDDFEADTLGDRPAGLFFRSYQPLDVKVEKDPTDNANKVFVTRDEEETRQYGNTFFDAQDGYVELYASVMAAQTTGSFSIGLYKTGNYTTSNGTINDCAARVVFANDSYIYDGTARKTKLLKYAPNTWYDIKVACNLKEKYCDIYIDGKLVAEKTNLNASNVESVNQFIFDTTDGTTATDTNRGGFFLDDIIIRVPKSLGKNPYLTDIKINGETVDGFAPQTLIYNVDMTAEELSQAKIEYESGETAKVMTWKGEGGVYITIISGNYKSTCTYYLKPKN